MVCRLRPRKHIPMTTTWISNFRIFFFSGAFINAQLITLFREFEERASVFDEAAVRRALAQPPVMAEFKVTAVHRALGRPSRVRRVRSRGACNFRRSLLTNYTSVFRPVNDRRRRHVR